MEMSTESVVVKSPFDVDINLFNNDASSPDIDFVIPGKGSFHLHRSVLEPASTLFYTLFTTKTRVYGDSDAKVRNTAWAYDIEEEKEEEMKKEKKAKFCEILREKEIRCVEMVETVLKDDADWGNVIFDIEEKRRIYRNVIVKLLRFCYGEDQTFKLEECGAALLVLSQLVLNKCEGAEHDIKEYMKLLAWNDIVKGVNMLEDCVLVYKIDKCNEKMNRFCEELTRIVMRKSNIENNMRFVTECLMKLPYRYLDKKIVGGGPSPAAEKYLKRHPELKTETKVAPPSGRTWPDLEIFCELLDANAIATTELNLRGDDNIFIKTQKK